jgi:putative tryptophan/tyrosine transport system substrate-binding protein
MKRRAFISLLGGMMLAPPARLMAQTASRVHRVALLVPFPANILTAFFDELRQHGFVEGQNLAVDRGGSGGGYEPFPALAAELVKAAPDAILCAGDAAIRAAQTATTTIPIVAATDDMVGSGLVRSLAHPGGNTTGVSLLAADLDGKRQEILIDFCPAARQTAALVDTMATGPGRLQALEDAARARGVTLLIQPVERSEDIEAAIEGASTTGALALNVLASPLLHGNRLAIIARTTALRLPAIYHWPETAQDGGLLGYGPRSSEFYRQWARQLVKVFPRGQVCRSAGRAADQVRACAQPQDRQGDRPRRAADAARARRRGDRMKRRQFMSLLGGAAATSSVSWPLGLNAQQPDRVRRVGWLDLVPASDPGAQARVAAFQQSLAKLGWTVGRNLAIDYRWGAFNLEAARLAVVELLGFAPEVAFRA